MSEDSLSRHTQYPDGHDMAFANWLARSKAELTDIIGAARAGWAAGREDLMEQIGAGGVGQVSPVSAMQDERAAFEAWFKRDYNESRLDRDEMGDYIVAWAAVMWDAWQARAALSQPVREPGWMPIESAPKDGTDVLVHAAGSTHAVSWCEDAEWWVVDDNKHGPYRLRGSEPTHWMPLPSAPGSPVKVREPMSVEQVRSVLAEAGYTEADNQALADFINGMRYAERFHGITKESA